jgi:hypothetical protein
VKFADRSFIQYKNTPLIVKVERTLAIALYHPDINEEVLQTEIYSQFILPHALWYTEVVYGRNIHPPKPSKETIDCNQYIAIVQDGSNSQIQAIQNTLRRQCDESQLNVIWANYSSGSHQRGPLHDSLSDRFKLNLRLKKRDNPSWGEWVSLQEIVEEALDSTLFPTIWNCFLNAQELCDCAIGMFSLQEAIEKSGISIRHPSPRAIFGHCPHYLSLSSQDADWLIEQLPRFSDRFLSKSSLSDEDFVNILRERPWIDNFSNERVIAHQPCFILVADELKERHLMAREDSRKVEEERDEFGGL